MDLKHKLMLITGASSGIGAATAQLAARQGARVVLVARSQDRLSQVADAIRAGGGQAHPYSADLGQPAAIADLAARISADLGTPDVLFNNAGAGRWLYTDETDMGEAAAMIAVPYLAAFSLTRAFLPAMIARNSGTIVNMSSIAGFLTWPGATAYTAARWAMRGFNAGLRADLHGTRVRTMLTVFARVDSAFWEHNPGSAEKIPGAQRMIPVLSAEQAARAIIHGLRRDRRFVAAPPMLPVVLALNYLFPQITRWLVFNTGARRPGHALSH